MASAQNFFNATPAPDPQQNPLMAGLAGGLQGVSNYGDYQKQLQMMQYQNQQKQMSDMINAGAQNRQAGFGPGPAGSTPMQIGGQQGYWDPNGMGPSGQMDMAKAQLYQTMTDNKQGAGNPEAVAAYHGAIELLKAKAAASVDSKGNSTFDTYGEMDKLHKYMNDNYNQDNQDSHDSTPQAQQPWQPGQPKTEAQSAAMALFNKGQAVNPATGAATGATATPRAQKNAQKADPRIQAAIDNFKKQGHSAERIKTDLKAKGMNPDDYNI